MNGKGIFVSGVGHTAESIKMREKAKEIIDELEPTRTHIKYDEDGLEIYEPEPHTEKEMNIIETKRREFRYNKYQAELRNRMIHKENTIKKKKNKRNMIKKSKKLNRRK